MSDRIHLVLGNIGRWFWMLLVVALILQLYHDRAVGAHLSASTDGGKHQLKK